MSDPPPRIAHRSSRWILHGLTLAFGVAGLAALAHFVFRELVPALDRLEMPARWWSGILAFILLAVTAILSAIAAVGSILARVHHHQRESAQQRRNHP